MSFFCSKIPAWTPFSILFLMSPWLLWFVTVPQTLFGFDDLDSFEEYRSDIFTEWPSIKICLMFAPSDHTKPRVYLGLNPWSVFSPSLSCCLLLLHRLSKSHIHEPWSDLTSRKANLRQLANRGGPKKMRVWWWTICWLVGNKNSLH